MNIESLNYNTWFGDRRLDTTPIHFHACSAPFTEETLYWVEQTLSGRYSVYMTENELDLFNSKIISFEDPQEALLYELKWS
jgi:hypothetical protein